MKSSKYTVFVAGKPHQARLDSMPRRFRFPRHKADSNEASKRQRNRIQSLEPCSRKQTESVMSRESLSKTNELNFHIFRRIIVSFRLPIVPLLIWSYNVLLDTTNLAAASFTVIHWSVVIDDSLSSMVIVFQEQSVFGALLGGVLA